MSNLLCKIVKCCIFILKIKYIHIFISLSMKLYIAVKVNTKDETFINFKILKVDFACKMYMKIKNVLKI